MDLEDYSYNDDVNGRMDNRINESQPNMTNYDEDMQMSDDNVPHIYMSMMLSRNRLGAAVYDASNCELKLVADMEETRPDFTMTLMLIQQVQPDVLVISGKSDVRMIEAIAQKKVETHQDADLDTIKHHDDHDHEILEHTSLSDNTLNSNGVQTPNRRFENDILNERPCVASERLMSTPFIPKLNQDESNRLGPYFDGEEDADADIDIDDVDDDRVSIRTERGDCEDEDEDCEDGDVNGNDVKLDELEHETVSSNGNDMTIFQVTNYLFSYEIAKNKLLKLELPDAPVNNRPEDMIIYISSIINMAHTNAIRSFGALVRFLEKNPLVNSLGETERSSLPIMNISYLSLNEFVSIDGQTMISLGIFNQEFYRPKTERKDTDELSLFRLFSQYCVSRIGINFLRRNVFLRPLRNIEMLEHRLNVISFFSDTQSFKVKNYLLEYLKNLKSLNGIMYRMKNGRTSVHDWKTLYASLWNAIEIKRIVKSNHVAIYIFESIQFHFNDDLENLFLLLKKIIDFKASLDSKHFQVNGGVDEKLDEKRKVFHDLPNILPRIAMHNIQEFNGVLPDCTCIYYPLIGFLITASIDDSNSSHDGSDLRSPSPPQIEGLTFKFDLDGKHYFKSAFMRTLDIRFGDMHLEINDIQKQIEFNLKEKVLSLSNMIFNVMNCCSELDCLIAMSHVAYAHEYVRPQLNYQDIMEIKGGRHALQEQLVDSFVSNDTYSSHDGHSERTKVKIITGPNACGKSVYLKQVCLITFLAHIGSFVPAKYAKIPIIDKMFTRIHTYESTSKGLSTFMVEMNQMTHAIKRATPSSLVVIDEFGKGTLPTDGLALFAACVSHWLQSESESPHLFISTHFHALSSLIPNKHLFTNQTLKTKQHASGLTHLYKLINGKAEGSFPCYVASLVNVPSSVIARFSDLVASFAEGKPIIGLKNPRQLDGIKEFNAIAQKILRFPIDLTPIHTPRESATTSNGIANTPTTTSPLLISSITPPTSSEN